MKRILHALAALWPGKKRALRTGHGEFADLPICEFAKSQPSESASKTAHQPMATARDLSESTNQRISESSRIGEVLEGLSIRTDRSCKFADLPIRELANESATSRISESATKNHPTDKTIFHLNRRYCNVLAYMILFMCLLAVKQVSSQTEPATTAVEITPLQIGDTIPEIAVKFLNRSTQVNDTSLSELAGGKWLILEFWNTICAPCITSMPHVFSLQEKFSDTLKVIPVTYESDAYIQRFLQKTRSPQMQELKGSFYTITDDILLAQLFPKESSPHTVILDGNGVVRSITHPQYLDESNLSDLIYEKGGDNITSLQSISELNLLKVNFNTLDDNLYYSVITGNMISASHRVRWETDSVNHRKRFTVSNAPITKLYTIALESPLPIDAKRRIIEVLDYENYLQSIAHLNRLKSETERHTTLCYEAVMPISMDDEEIKKRMKYDLDFYLQLKGEIELRTVRCLVLRKIDNSHAFVTNSDERKRVLGGKIQHRLFDYRSEPGSLPNGVDTYLRYGTFVDVVNLVDEIVDETLPVVLNETGHTGRFDLDFPSPSGATIEVVNTYLRVRGLELQWADRDIEMFVLTEKGYKGNSDTLRLTDIGYTYSTFQN